MTQNEIYNASATIANYCAETIDEEGTIQEIGHLIQAACQSDSIAFGEWLPRNAQPITNNPNWIYNKDRKEYTTSDLYDIFHKENQGK